MQLLFNAQGTQFTNLKGICNHRIINHRELALLAHNSFCNITWMLTLICLILSGEKGASLVDPARRQRDMEGMDDVSEMCSKHAETGKQPEVAYPQPEAVALQVAVDHQLQSRSATASEHETTQRPQQNKDQAVPSGFNSRAQGHTEKGTHMSGVCDGMKVLSHRDVASRMAVAAPALASALPQQKEQPAQHHISYVSAPSNGCSIVEEADEPTDLSSLRQNALPTSQSRSVPQLPVTRLPQVSRPDMMVIIDISDND